MIEWTIPNMTCGHCAGVVTRTLHEADPDAQVTIDIAARRVQVLTALDADRLAEALSEEGYAPTPATGS